MNLCKKCFQRLTVGNTLVKNPPGRRFGSSSSSKFLISQRKSSLPRAETNVRHVLAGCIFAGAAVTYLYTNWQNTTQTKKSPPLSSKKPKSARERRFLQFASVEYDGITYMTPKNFLESVIDDEPRQRKKTKLLDHKSADSYMRNIPIKTYGSMFFFRDVGERGLISYPEYVFLLSNITQSRRAFKIGFELIDKNRNNELSKEEFIDFVSLVGGCPVHTSKKNHIGKEVNTSLLVHLFGKDGAGKVTFKEYRRFIENLQEELLHAEFTEYSRGTGRISEEDLARILLRYTSLSEAEQDELVEHLHSLLPEKERVGITFAEYVTFMLLLNNVYSLAVMLRMFQLAQRSVNKNQFIRAAKVCLDQVYEELAEDDTIPCSISEHTHNTTEGQPNKEKLHLSPHIVDVIFYMLNKRDNDDELNYEELISMIYDRKNKGVRTILNNETWEGLGGFGKCIRNEIKLQKMEHELLRSQEYDQ